VAYGVLLFLAGQFAAAIVLVIGGLVDLQTGEVDTLPVAFVVVAVTAGWIGLIGWPVYASYAKGRRSLRRDFGFALTGGDIGWGLLGGLVAIVLSMVANGIWMVFSAADETPTNADFLPSSPSAFEAVALFALIAIGTPIAEELFFRGLFLRALEKRWNVVVAVIVSSLVFGAFHAQGGISAEAAFIVAVTAVYGLVFALLTVWRGRLGPAIVAHMAVNGIGVIAAFALT
jgi:uncharacterized protein